MQNPWLSLSSVGQPYLLEMDRLQIDEFNQKQKESAKLVLKSIPEPFIGDPNKAKVVLLLLNPGHDEEDPAEHAKPEFKNALFRNLRREDRPYPFYPLNPAFKDTPSAKWWLPRTQKLAEEAKLSSLQLSEKILAIEWFPYHSKSSGLRTKKVCESQEYTFHLAKEMLATRFVVRMRSRNHWTSVDRGFAQVPSLKNPRSGYISRGNTEGGLFDRILSTLKET